LNESADTHSNYNLIFPKFCFWPGFLCNGHR